MTALFDATKIDPWFLGQLKEIIDAEHELLDLGPIAGWKYEYWREVKRLGFSDARIGEIVGLSELQVRELRKAARATPFTRRWTPAPPNSRPIRPITTPPTSGKTRLRALTSQRS
ncbi:hypothetical protein ACFSC4_13430 [Deinococcus malanensis]|uniref:hypothetical protein n=1 Tax=Deinococcus malanensis TaxID=1706855 RepID=UPI0036270C12